MHCKSVMQELDAFRTRELPERILEEIAEHVAICGVCSESLIRLNRLALDAAGAGPKAPGRILDGVSARLGDRYGPVETELGRIWVAFSERGVSMLSLSTPDGAAFEAEFRRRRKRPAHPGDVTQEMARAIEAAARGVPSRRLPVDLAGLTGFEREVLLQLRRVPRGQVRPYQWLARRAGIPGAARAVGNVMARNPVPVLLPCHRIVPSTGGVGHYAFGSSVKLELLKREDVPVEFLDSLSGRGIRYVGSSTTGVYCYPTCRDARRIREENRVLFSDEEDAGSARFRPCRRCGPPAPSSGSYPPA